MRVSTLVVCFAATVMLAGCAGLGGLTKTDRQQMTLHLENAANFYDAGRYDSAYQQWGLALQFDGTLDKARLGRAMALYQLGMARTPVGLERLRLAEQQLDELRNEQTEGMQWRAELGYGLVQARWAELYDQKIQLVEYQLSQGYESVAIELPELRKTRNAHVAAADSSFASVLSEADREPRDRLTCTLGRARMAAMRGDLESSLKFARQYQKNVVASKQLWKDSILQYPGEARQYRMLLEQVEAHEAELLDLLGNVLFDLGRIEEAEKQLDEAIAIRPTRGSTYLSRGIVRQELKQWDLSRGDYESFLQLAALPPDDPNVVEAQARLLVVRDEIISENRRIEAGLESGEE